MTHLIEDHWPHIETLVFSAGTDLVIPDLPEEPEEDVPFWLADDEEAEEEGGT